MATAILRHESLSLRHHSLLGSRRNPNPNPNMIMPKSNHEFSRKRNPVGFKSINKRQSESMVTKPPGKNLVMGQVKILKRGEPLVAATEKTDRRCSDGSRGDYEVDLSLGSTNRLGPDPETMQKQIKLKEFKIGSGFYAGSSSLVSPPPSFVPVPEFLGRTARVQHGSQSTSRRLSDLEFFKSTKRYIRVAIDQIFSL
ncbi:hypothetical protein Gogos_004598 [Gossypium gossypioides]|uniref:Uncharacterized protein n=1 Tax=Gossypium gossypioides TaxID=34282 RepID=A0A7J9CH09_GOSGO|nr:hypothetical protein [Gossypium gossypioides]